MKPILVPGDPSDEVARLIEVLHATGQRLEELTAGEVDTVADRDGRTFLLRSAQDQLRLSEAAKQAAILNALPARIALLDSQGLIISVNEAWRRFGSASAMSGPGYGIGLNYLKICDCIRGDHASEAHQVAKGIRSVLDGAAKSFSLEYPCHTLTEQRWFLLTVTPLADDHPNGAVIMHSNVTAVRQTEESLRASELRFRQMAENIRDVFWLTDPAKNQVLYVSPAYEQIWGRTCESVYASPRDWIDAIHPEDRERMRQAVLGQASGHYVEEYRIVRPDGSIRSIRERAFPVFRNGDEVDRITGLAEDITERKEAEGRIVYLNRVYAVLSGINALIVRASDRDQLFREACRIAVEDGGFRMAWIGILEPGMTKVVPVASAGMDEELLAAIKDRHSSSEDALSGNTIAARAMKEKKAIVSNDLHSNPRVFFGRRHVESGILSMAILPLIVSGEGIGVLALYASEHEFFHEEELKLLSELAGDIAFGIDHIQKAEKLNYLAYYDVLTGLANRTLFLERVGQYMRSAVTGKHQLALFLVDLERFKSINDSLGQSAGDTLLRQASEWLTRNVGDPNLSARVGADHFAVVLPQVKQEGDVGRLLDKMIASFMDHPFRLNGSIFRVAAKVGVALFPDDGDTADTLFKNAEAALKKAKASGDRYLFYTQTMNDTVAVKLTLENRMRQALDKAEFVLHYQPKMNLESGKLTSAEALIRWNDPRTGLVPPSRFIPLLEETGLIHEVGRWALRKAVADYLRWRNAGLPAVRIAVNVSPLQLRNRGFIAEIEKVIGIDAHAAAGLELEITESVIMEDVKHSIATLNAIRAMGVRIAIDDFGTGFSSLSYLSRLPVDTLKIDRSFVVDMVAGPEGLALVSTIINLAHSLKLNVVAEGVESEEQSRLLRLLSCDEVQGFLFSQAVPGEMFETRYLACVRPDENASAGSVAFESPFAGR